ncbi:MAG: hypothetical protein JXO51_07895 [Candidatus Aminicenantes bacterium]|nr:hypothetical protein [Candidatus Aminicenantes bacterium]
MDARSRIEEEKLQNILNPRKSNREFKITIRFQKHLSRNFEKALALARKNAHFMEEGEGDFYKAYASFHPQDVEGLFELFELVKDHETTKIFLNNKAIPYVQDLWLFLLWFYRVK